MATAIVGKRNTSAQVTLWYRLIALVLIFACNEMASVYLGWMLGFGVSLFTPLDWLLWFLDPVVSKQIPHHVMVITIVIVIAGAFGAVLLGWWLGYRRSLVKQETPGLHGTAHFAVATEVDRTGLFGDKGVVCGGYPDNGVVRLLKDNGPGHIAVGAPTRSGKGVVVIIPTMISWPHSTAANDIKGEIFALTSGFRHRAGQLVLRFEPTSMEEKVAGGRATKFDSVRWNPLEEIRIFTPMDVQDAQNLAAAIADPEAKGMDDHWVSSSYELFIGMFLHVAYSSQGPRSLPEVSRRFGDPKFASARELLEDLKTAEHDMGRGPMWLIDGRPSKTHPAVLDMAVKMLAKEDKELSGVVSSAVTKLALFVDPIVAANVDYSDFRITDLMNHALPVSLYLVVRPSDNQRLRPLIRLFFQFMTARLCSSIEFDGGQAVRSYRHRLLKLIDELPALKKMDTVEVALGFEGGFGIKSMLVFQDKDQLNAQYGENETITAGCKVQIYFAPNTAKTADFLSTMCGVTTIDRQTTSFSGKRGSPTLSEMSVNEEQIERPLLTSDEVRSLPDDDMLIQVAGHPVIRGRKTPYYKIPEMLRRTALEVPSKFEVWRDSNTGVARHWMMVSLDWEDNEVTVQLRVYDLFPLSRWLASAIKRDGSIVELHCDVIGTHAHGRDGHWESDHDEIRLRFDKKIERTDSMVLRIDPPEGWSTRGALSVMGSDEREAIEKARALTAKDAYVENVSDGIRLKGMVLGETDVFVIFGECLEGAEWFSIHRRAWLTGRWEINTRAVIKYLDGRATIS